jgi:hypothetical protein
MTNATDTLDIIDMIALRYQVDSSEAFSAWDALTGATKAALITAYRNETSNLRDIADLAVNWATL